MRGEKIMTRASSTSNLGVPDGPLGVVYDDPYREAIRHPEEKLLEADSYADSCQDILIYINTTFFTNIFA